MSTSSMNLISQVVAEVSEDTQGGQFEHELQLS